MNNRALLALAFLTLPARIAAQVTVTISNPPLNGTPGMTINVTESARNTGTASVPAGTQSIALWPASGGGPLTILGSRPLPALAVGAISTASTTLTIPASVAPGTYVIGAGRISALGCLGCLKSSGTITVATAPQVTVRVFISGHGSANGGLESTPFHQPYFANCSAPAPFGCMTSGPAGSAFVVTAIPGTVPGSGPFGHSHPANFAGWTGAGCVGVPQNGGMALRIVASSNVTCTATFQ